MNKLFSFIIFMLVMAGCTNPSNEEKDWPAETIEDVTEAAENGNAEAQNELGLRYYSGDAVSKSYMEAVRWWKKATEQKNAHAQNNLGYCYYYGNGISKSYAEAVRWWQKAAEQEDAVAQYNLGVCYARGRGVEQNDEETLRLWQKSAEQGCGAAQYELENHPSKNNKKSFYPSFIFPELSREMESIGNEELGEGYDPTSIDTGWIDLTK